jgi:hypothetical protein
MATLASSGRISTHIVEEEVKGWLASWGAQASRPFKPIFRNFLMIGSWKNLFDRAQLAFVGNEVKVEVRDQGKGMPSGGNGSHKKVGVGIQGMRGQLSNSTVASRFFPTKKEPRWWRRYQCRVLPVRPLIS